MKKPEPEEAIAEHYLQLAAEIDRPWVLVNGEGVRLASASTREALLPVLAEMYPGAEIRYVGH